MAAVQKGLPTPNPRSDDYRFALAVWEAISILNGNLNNGVIGRRAVRLDELTTEVTRVIRSFSGDLSGKEPVIVPASSAFFWDGSKTFRAIGIGDVSSLTSTLNALANGYVAKTANYTTTAVDRTIDCTANTFNVTVVTAVGNAALKQDIKNSGAGVITVLPDGAETFNGYTSIVLRGAPFNDSVTIQSTGAGWIII